MIGITPTVSSFASSIRWSKLPDSVREASVSALASVLSLSASTSTNAMVRELDAFIEPITSQNEKGSFAALRIATTAFSRLAADASLQEELSCVVVPAGFVAAQFAGCSGPQLLTAVAIGLEIALRMVESLGEDHRGRGWDVVGSAGRIGATVAASVVIGLDAKQLQSALGFASTMVAGLHLAGSDLRALGAGKSSADGVEAAVLAGEGLLGPVAPLEGRRGLFALVSPDPHPEILVEGLGDRWLFVDKMTPSGLDAAAGLLVGAADTSIFAASFERLVVTTP